MRKMLASASLVLAAVTVPLAPTAAASGTPQRSATVPPGLAKKLLNPTSGILKALIATIGSNRRLQDLPVSP